MNYQVYLTDALYAITNGMRLKERWYDVNYGKENTEAELEQAKQNFYNDFGGGEG